MKKITTIFITATLIFVFAQTVIAFSNTTFEDKSSTYPNRSSGKVYTVTYEMNNEGWYLLPSQLAVSAFKPGEDLQSFYRASDYKFAFSPFSKKYTQCVRKPNINPLACDLEDIYRIPEEELWQLPKESAAREYLAYTGLSADWHYYSKPTTVTYQYYPFMLGGFQKDDDDIGLFAVKLKSGWNYFNQEVQNETILP